MKFLIALAFAIMVLSIAAATPALAGVGIQTGLSTSPDDFVIGVHWKSQPMGESLFMVPSVEAGFGDATMIAGNLDLHYDLKTKSKLAPYIGGGLTLNWFDFDAGGETDFGGSFLGGIQLNQQMFFETKLGLGDVPDWKFLIGWHAK
jgi:opacity protein-like surface antigen